MYVHPLDKKVGGGLKPLYTQFHMGKNFRLNNVINETFWVCERKIFWACRKYRGPDSGFSIYFSSVKNNVIFAMSRVWRRWICEGVYVGCQAFEKVDSSCFFIWGAVVYTQQVACAKIVCATSKQKRKVEELCDWCAYRYAVTSYHLRHSFPQVYLISFCRQQNLFQFYAWLGWLNASYFI